MKGGRFATLYFLYDDTDTTRSNLTGVSPAVAAMSICSTKGC